MSRRTEHKNPRIAEAEHIVRAWWHAMAADVMGYHGGGAEYDQAAFQRLEGMETLA